MIAWQVDQVNVEFHHRPQATFGELISDADGVGSVRDRLFGRWQVLLMLDHLHVSDRGRSPFHDRSASTQQVTRVSQIGRVHVAGGKVSTSQQHREFFRINVMGLGFPSVISFQVQRVSEPERQSLSRAQVGQPSATGGGYSS